MAAQESSTGLKRRSLVKGTAWAAPTIALGSAAPAMAASRPPGLQGWVTVGKSCDRDDPDTLTINGTGGNNANPPNSGSRGLWVYNTTSNTTLSNARMTFYYPTSLGTIPWSPASGNSGWSTPAPSTVDPAISGFTAYTTYYSGSWTYRGGHSNPLDDHHLADGRPNFRASLRISYCGSNLSVYARRTITVGGDVISFRRGPVYL